nr:MFS transporter, ACS family, glucarate transporter [Candidatus Pantoea persica]
MSRFGWEWPFFVLGGIGVSRMLWCAYRLFRQRRRGGRWHLEGDQRHRAERGAWALQGGIFNGVSNIAGFVTPLLFLFLFLFVVGPITRVGEAQTPEAAREEQKAARGIKAV